MDDFSAFEGSEWDWHEAFKYASEIGGVPGYTGSLKPYTINDVLMVFRSVEGENDGASWVAVMALKDGRYASIRAGCDYTGWG